MAAAKASAPHAVTQAPSGACKRPICTPLMGHASGLCAFSPLAAATPGGEGWTSALQTATSETSRGSLRTSPRLVNPASAIARYVAVCAGDHTRSTPMVDSHEKSHNRLTGMQVAASSSTQTAIAETGGAGFPRSAGRCTLDALTEE